ncbi:MAG: hypothetical protein M9904_06235 [Chitinophagaceae bacterium]|nr:hypothetical protein [Chitinophagaceae bacterium]
MTTIIFLTWQGLQKINAFEYPFGSFRYVRQNKWWWFIEAGEILTRYLRQSKSRL